MLWLRGAAALAIVLVSTLVSTVPGANVVLASSSVSASKYDMELDSVDAEEGEMQGGSAAARRRSRRRRRRRRRKTTGARRRRRRRRRRSTVPVVKPKPVAAAAKADAKPAKIEGGWGDLAKRGEFFTVFVTGGGFDPAKDRIVVLHGSDTCGSPTGRLAKVTGQGEKPSSVAGWNSLPCNAIGSSGSKLACGDGEANGVMFPDDKWVDTYTFKVCVCDFSKKNKCASLPDFDVTPSNPTLKVNPVI